MIEWSVWGKGNRERRLEVELGRKTNLEYHCTRCFIERDSVMMRDIKAVSPPG